MDEATSSVSCTHTLTNAALIEEEVGIVYKNIFFVDWEFNVDLHLYGQRYQPKNNPNPYSFFHP